MTDDSFSILFYITSLIIKKRKGQLFNDNKEEDLKHEDLAYF